MVRVISLRGMILLIAAWFLGDILLGPALHLLPHITAEHIVQNLVDEACLLASGYLLFGRKISPPSNYLRR